MGKSGTFPDYKSFYYFAEHPGVTDLGVEETLTGID